MEFNCIGQRGTSMLVAWSLVVLASMGQTCWQHGISVELANVGQTCWQQGVYLYWSAWDEHWQHGV